MSVEIVTYANKSQGMYEELINNEFGIPIKVLGWGLHFYIDIQKNNLIQSSFLNFSTEKWKISKAS